jgi:cytochrome c550
MSNHENHVDEVNGMKQGHGKVPRFLIIVYAVLAVWAVYYAIAAKGIDETNAAPTSGVSAEQGKVLMGQSCAICHGQNFKGGLGPTLQGVVEAKGEDYVKQILTEGGTTMTPVAKDNNWSDDQIQSVIEAMKEIQ